MLAHAQFCWTGDNTLEATKSALDKIKEQPGEDYFVIVLSDANFSRYGIDPALFGSLMTSDLSVNVFAVFIGSLGNQALRSREWHEI